MARLRAPGGCPWDREQTFDSIKQYTIEETYEVLDAIERRDWEHLSEELGDFILQAVFYSQMAAEAGHFSIDGPLEAISEKLIRRHPHVFEDAIANTPDDVKKRWDEIKAEEKKDKGTAAPQGLLDGVPKALPALMEAQQLTDKAARVGFDWRTADEVIAKLHEELGELAEARLEGSRDELEGEIGDLLFVLVNLSRFLRIDAEQALRRTNAKFRRRFGHVERELAKRGAAPAEAAIDEMEALWQEAKRAE
ncbi:MAG TPA: nucleoside triphosphate pyrophosphohydrolase [Solibacterales bacterium]|nr:nucleoside triphosphate pyrophosphohydrolase [Bryobacterales bacterium]